MKYKSIRCVQTICLNARLPPFTTNVHSDSGGDWVPFEDLFDDARFIAGMRLAGVRVLHRSECRPAHFPEEVSGA